jgi:hypothetical protein
MLCASRKETVVMYASRCTTKMFNASHAPYNYVYSATDALPCLYVLKSPLLCSAIQGSTGHNLPTQLFSNSYYGLNMA